MQPILALVDSGATHCVFPASLGEVLGIDISSGVRHNFYGFNRQETPGFIHPVNLQVQGFPHWVNANAVFIESEVLSVLGQYGFFEHYQIVFERFQRRFEVNTKADAVIRRRRGAARHR